MEPRYVIIASLFILIGLLGWVKYFELMDKEDRERRKKTPK
jgi:hypothetical protein